MNNPKLSQPNYSFFEGIDDTTEIVAPKEPQNNYSFFEGIDDTTEIIPANKTEPKARDYSFFEGIDDTTEIVAPKPLSARLESAPEESLVPGPEIAEPSTTFAVPEKRKPMQEYEEVTVPKPVTAPISTTEAKGGKIAKDKYRLPTELVQGKPEKGSIQEKIQKIEQTDSDIAKHFRTGNVASAIDIMAFKDMISGGNNMDEILIHKSNLEEALQKNPDEQKTIVGRTIDAVSEMLPAMGKGTAATLAGTIIAPGIGTAAGASYWMMQGAGSMYSGLRKEGIPHETAMAIALPAGALYGGVETLQVSKLLGKGGKAAIENLIKGKSKNILQQYLKMKGIDYIKENAEEIAQNIIEQSAMEIGKQIEGKSDKSAKDIIANLISTSIQTFKQSALPLLVIGAPTTVVGITQAKAAQSEKLKFPEVKQAEPTITPEPTAPTDITDADTKKTNSINDMAAKGQKDLTTTAAEFADLLNKKQISMDLVDKVAPEGVAEEVRKLTGTQEEVGKEKPEEENNVLDEEWTFEIDNRKRPRITIESKADAIMKNRPDITREQAMGAAYEAAKHNVSGMESEAHFNSWADNAYKNKPDEGIIKHFHLGGDEGAFTISVGSGVDNKIITAKADSPYFAGFNDTFGHIWTDKLMEKTQGAIRDEINDANSRMAGLNRDEKIKLYLETIKKIKTKLNNKKVKLPNGNTVTLGIDVGVAFNPNDAENILNASKKEGRNAIVIDKELERLYNISSERGVDPLEQYLKAGLRSDKLKALAKEKGVSYEDEGVSGRPGVYIQREGVNEPGGVDADRERGGAAATTATTAEPGAAEKIATAETEKPKPAETVKEAETEKEKPKPEDEFAEEEIEESEEAAPEETKKKKIVFTIPKTFTDKISESEAQKAREAYGAESAAIKKEIPRLDRFSNHYLSKIKAVASVYNDKTKRAGKRQLLETIQGMNLKSTMRKFLKGKIGKAKASADVDNIYNIIKDQYKKRNTAAILKKASDTIDAEKERLKKLEKARGKDTLGYEVNKRLQTYLDKYTTASEAQWKASEQKMREMESGGIVDMGKYEDIVETSLRVPIETLSDAELEAIPGEIAAIKEAAILYEAEQAKKSEMRRDIYERLKARTKETVEEFKGSITRAREAAAKEKGIQKTFKSFLKSMTLPENIIKGLSGWSENDMLYKEVWGKPWDAQTKEWKIQEKARKVRDEIHKDITPKEMASEVEIKYTEISPEGDEIVRTETATIDDLMRVYAYSQSPEGMGHLIGGGYDALTVEEILEFLPDKYITAVDSMIDWLDSEGYKTTNPAFIYEHGVDMPKRDRYFPIMNLKINTGAGKDAILTELVQRFNLKEGLRRGHTIKTTGSKAEFSNYSYMAALDKHIIDMAHYAAWADVIPDVNAILNDADIKALMEKEDPEGVAMLNDWVRRIAYGRLMPSTSELSRLIEGLVARGGKAVLGFNIQTILKQIPSLVTGYAGMTGNIVEKSTVMAKVIASSPIERHKSVADLSVYMRNRNENVSRTITGLEKEINVMIKENGKVRDAIKKAGVAVDKIGDISMQPIRFADMVVVDTLWEAEYNLAYNKMLEKYRKSGIDAEKAKEMAKDEAIKKADALIRNTQPSSTLIELPKMFTEPGFYRGFVAFKNQLMKNTNFINATWQKYHYDKISLGKAMFDTWLVLVGSGTAMYVITTGASKLPWKKDQIPLWIKNMLMQAMAGYILLGNAFEVTYDGIMKAAKGKKYAINPYAANWWPFSLDIFLNTFEEIQSGKPGRWAGVAATTAAHVAGLPYVAARRVIKGAGAAAEGDIRRLGWSASQLETEADRMAKLYNKKGKTREELQEIDAWWRKATKQERKEITKKADKLLEEKQKERQKKQKEKQEKLEKEAKRD